MKIGEFLASQIRQPSGWFGKYVVSRTLNKDNAAMNDLALEMLNIGHNQIKERILEIGFGGGYLLDKILCESAVELVVGVDISPEMVNLCQQRFWNEIAAKRVELCCMHWDELPYPSSNFTKVCTVNTIYFWDNVVKTLGKLNQVLQPDGLLVICFNTKEFLNKTILPQHDFRVYEPEQIRDWMEIVGFGNIRYASVSDRKQDFICIVGEKQLQSNQDSLTETAFNQVARENAEFTSPQKIIRIDS